MEFLGAVFEFVRDLAVLCAAAGVARWAWADHVEAPARRDAQARAGIDRERQAADLRQWAGRMEAHALAVATRLDDGLAHTREAEARGLLAVRIHHMLQTTTDPFLTFAEIRDGLAGPVAASTEAVQPDEAATPATTPAVTPVAVMPAAVTETILRRALLGLIADGAVTQLSGDRYFIASDFEAAEDDGA